MTAASCGTLTALTLGLPAGTAIAEEKGTLPKQMFYAKRPISSKLKQRFTNDLESVTMLALLRAANTGLADGAATHEILLMGLKVSCEEVPVELVDYISHMRNCGIIFVCCRTRATEEGGRVEECALAVRRPLPTKPGYEKRFRVYVGPWRPVAQTTLELKGQNMDEAWDSLNAQVILDSSDGADLDARIARRSEIAGLVVQEAKLAKDHSRAKDPAQRNEIYSKLHKVRNQLRQMGALD
ncbi:hypothetical protein KIMH_11870 [Bombiscardovia apis]|uniref:DUF4391 domain-containing protein n=1 Tax=Bombiscardovia apis TaxID=2932182 RepID=A0ABN6SGG4_9BIFI|nr:DUF4391 domain-containing protein [Bombiscardovia apis]BDR55076.1 hypothetical protein KIMH_11870 [Bombiscardovia apis]